MVFSLVDLTSAQLLSLATSNSLKDIAWFIPRFSEPSPKAMRLRLDSQLFIYSFNSSTGEASLHELYGIKGK